MSAGRRGLVLAVTFLGLALWLCPQQRAKAQQPGPGKHKIWNRDLSPDQIRDLLTKFGQNPGKDAPFEELLNRMLRDKNPDVPQDRIDETVKRFLNDKEFRDRVIDLAQRMQNQNPNQGGNPKNGGFRPEDLQKLIEVMPDNLKKEFKNGNGEPFKLPKVDPNKLPPFDPNNPQFDPKRFPGIDPDNPPQFDPNTKFPLDDKGRPFDPRDPRHTPIDPANPPRIDPAPPAPPQLDPMNPNVPKVDQPPPVAPPNNDGGRKFDPDNPLGKPDAQDGKTKSVETLTALWEKNVGPIDESPSVKRAIMELVSDPDIMEVFTDAKGRNLFDFEKDANGDWFKGLFDGGGGWEWPKFDFNWGRGGRDLDLDFGEPRRRNIDISPRDTGSRGSGGGLGSFDLGSMKGIGIVLLVILALFLAVVLVRNWNKLVRPRAATVGAGGLPAWPVDPRSINSREDVVKAFEYLSVMICGPGAKMWTHSTIADALSELAATNAEAAVKLARLYELARYAPLDEPLTRAELVEARRLVCDLAGMDE